MKQFLDIRLVFFPYSVFLEHNVAIKIFVLRLRILFLTESNILYTHTIQNNQQKLPSKIQTQNLGPIKFILELFEKIAKLFAVERLIS